MPVSVRKSQFRVEHLAFSVAFALGLLLASLLLIVFGSKLLYAGRIYPGVSVAGIDVSGMTANDASARILSQLAYPSQGHILLTDKEKPWLVSPGELGLFLDPEATAKNAYQVGRSGSLSDNIQEQFDAWYTGRDLPPSLVFDQRMAYQYLASLAAVMNVPAVEPAITLQGTQVNVTPAQLGRYLDIDATLKPLTRQIQSLADGTVPLVMVETPPAILDVSQQADLARSILNQNLVLTLPEGLPDQQGPWTFDPPTLARMLTFERVEDASGARYQVSLNSTELRQFLTDLAPKLSQTPRNTHFTFNDETSQLEVIQPAVIGRVLDVDGSIRTIQENLYAAKHTVPLVFITTPPPVTDQMTGEQLGITELVHVEYSYFFGSGASRVQNIKIAASSFHGLLIAPGETFSMASVMGDISLDNGYAEAMIIMNGRTIKGVGGGVCQVSTTLFRAAFFSGFPIVERQPHAYRVSYYERRANGAVDPNLAGLDATVFVPLVDLKFTNDTPYWLLMETYVSEARQQITWKFYSTKDGRNVEWTTTGPENIVPAPEALYKENPDLPQGEVKQVDWTADGADVTVDRKVYKDGNVYLHDVITTHYEPWQAIYEYGPGTEGMPPPDQ